MHVHSDALQVNLGGVTKAGVSTSAVSSSLTCPSISVEKFLDIWLQFTSHIFIIYFGLICSSKHTSKIFKSIVKQMKEDTLKKYILNLQMLGNRL